MIDEDAPPAVVSARWEEFVADLEAIAEDYREAGYEVLAVHAGDVTALPDDLALDVLAPDDEYDRLQSLVEGAEFDEFTVFTAEEGGVTFGLVVAEDGDAEVAVCVPVFYSEAVTEGLGQRARDTGAVDLRVRPLSDESRVVFTLEEPELLF